MSSSTSTSSASPVAIPGRAVTSPPLDPSKLNQQPANLPSPPPVVAQGDPNVTAPLRSPEQGPGGPGGPGTLESAYLDTGLAETPSHPTVAETGDLSVSQQGPGPRSGQLKRNEEGAKGQKEIIKLGSFGGEGLALKPAVGSPPVKDQ